MSKYIPTTSPSNLSKGPPELPGFIATPYPFNILDHPDSEEAGELLQRRSLDNQGGQKSFEEDALLFEPGDSLKIVINTALAVGKPLLLTGDTGTGKTQTAYYIAKKLGLGKVLHFQGKSNSLAQDMLYHFDNVKYFRYEKSDTASDELKMECINKGVLWKALVSPRVRVVLIDEIDKTPRDFPNDLLHEIDKMEFKVHELNEDTVIGDKNSCRPIVIITSNSESRLPDAFLRRCNFHHIEYSEEILINAIEAHSDEFSELDKEFVKYAVKRFEAVRENTSGKKPSTGECLVWLRVMAKFVGFNKDKLSEILEALKNDDDEALPFAGVLIKNRNDMRPFTRKM